jgi:hypothetical protein
MKIGEIISIVRIVWDIVSKLIDVYKSLEEKYQWSKEKGPVVKAEVQEKKKSEFDASTTGIFASKGLPTPTTETKVYIREFVHSRLGVKPT